MSPFSVISLKWGFTYSALLEIEHRCCLIRNQLSLCYCLCPKACFQASGLCVQCLSGADSRLHRWFDVKICRPLFKLILISFGLLLFFCDIVEQLSSAAVLHDKEKVFGSLDNLIKLDEIGVANQFEYVYLSGDSFNVRDVYNFLFFKNFDCHFLPCGFVNSQFDLPESSLSQILL